MKKETTFFTANATILKHEETVQDVMQYLVHKGQEEPFFVLDVGDIVKKVKVWKLKLPRVQPFYAVKCNNDPTVLETLASLGTGFDCASKSEIQQVLDLGIDASRIIYAHPCKPASHLKMAAKNQVQLMTFDNQAELYKVKQLFPQAKLVLRIRCDAEKAQCPLGIKFGADPQDAPELLSLARDLGLDIVGVSFHVGSGCEEPPVFYRAIKAAREVFDEAIKLGFQPDLLDIGGGYPGHKGASLDELAFHINTALEDFFPPNCGVRVIAEPGRYMVASAFTLATAVISKREVLSDSGELVSTMYYINDGVYGSFNCILFDHQKVVPQVLKKTSDSDKSSPCSIWGPTCDGLDQVVNEAVLPSLKVGDWLVWEDMGAYTLTAANTFNGFPLAQVQVVVPLHSWLYLEQHLGAELLDEPEQPFDKKMSEMSQQSFININDDLANILSSLALVE